MKLAVDMLRILYLVNVYQPLPRAELMAMYLSEKRTESAFNAALRYLQSEKYLGQSDPLTCRPRGLAALQSLRLYKFRDAGRLFSLKRLAESDSPLADERREEE